MRQAVTLHDGRVEGVAGFDALGRISAEQVDGRSRIVHGYRENNGHEVEEPGRHVDGQEVEASPLGATVSARN